MTNPTEALDECLSEFESEGRALEAADLVECLHWRGFELVPAERALPALNLSPLPEPEQ